MQNEESGFFKINHPRQNLDNKNRQEKFAQRKILRKANKIMRAKCPVSETLSLSYETGKKKKKKRVSQPECDTAIPNGITQLSCLDFFWSKAEDQFPRLTPGYTAQTEGGSVTRYGREHQLCSACLDLFIEYRVISLLQLHVFRLWEETIEHKEAHALSEIMQPTYTLEI